MNKSKENELIMESYISSLKEGVDEMYTLDNPKIDGDELGVADLYRGADETFEENYIGKALLKLEFFGGEPAKLSGHPDSQHPGASSEMRISRIVVKLPNGTTKDISPEAIHLLQDVENDLAEQMMSRDMDF